MGWEDFKRRKVGQQINLSLSVCFFLERGLNRYGNESGVQILVNVMFYSCTLTAGGSNRGARDRGAEPDHANASARVGVT